MNEKLNELLTQIEGVYPELLTYDVRDLGDGAAAAKDALDKFLNAVTSKGLMKTDYFIDAYPAYHAQLVTALQSIEYARGWPWVKMFETLNYLLRDLHDYLSNELSKLEKKAPKYGL